MSHNLKHCGLPEHTIVQIQQVMAQYPPLARVRLYGSRAKGNFRHGSDIDLCIMEHNLTPQQLANLSNDLENLPTPYLIDLITFDTLENAQLIEHIQRVGIDFYVKNQNSGLKVHQSVVF